MSKWPGSDQRAMLILSRGTYFVCPRKPRAFDGYTTCSGALLLAAARRRHMLDKATYLDAFHREAAALAAAARGGLDAPVPSCPGWTVATLLGHLTGIY